MAMAMASSSWVVSHGSLDSCVTLVFLDPLTHEPLDIPPSSSTTEKLILVPPPDPVPCEITVKFQRRLCHVQNFYILSTARICELYSQARAETDSEYICTVKGWLPEDAETFQSSETVSQVCIHETNKTWSSNEKTGIDNSVNIEDDLERLGSSSGEDSWVELKLNGSLNSETKFEAETSSTHNGTDNHELYCSINPVDLKIRENHSPCVEQNISLTSKQLMYEAELELVDHSPWEVITIRLLSLQDRSQVEVDQVVILAVSGPEIPEIVASTQSAEKGPNSEMLAMFLPSMLQMAQRVSRARFSVDPSKSGASIQPPEQGVNMLEKAVDLSCKDEVEEQAEPQLDIESYATEAQHNELCQSKVEETILRNACRPSQSSVHAVDMHGHGSDSSNCVDESLSRTMLLTLETFSKRFDRLETLCLRMESYLQSAFERIDQRITLLEGRQGEAFKRTSSFDLSLSGERHGESSPNVQFGKYHQKIARQSPGEEPCPNLNVESVVLPEYKGAGSVPLDGHASASVSAEGHGDSFANTSTTDGYLEQTLLTGQAAESCPSSTVRSGIFPEHGFKDDVLTFVETVETGKGSNLTSASDGSAKEAASYSSSAPTKKLYGSLDDAWMTALTAFTSCYSQDDEDSNNLRFISNDEQSDGTDEYMIKHCEIENIDHANVNCKIEVESEEYDIRLEAKSDYISSCQCSSDLMQLKQSSENESNINDEVEWKQPLKNHKLELKDSASRSGGSLNDSVYGLPETQVSDKHMRQESTDSKLEYRAGNFVFSSLSDGISLHSCNKLRAFGSVGCSSVGDIQFCSSQVKSGPSLLNQSSLDIETIDDYAVDSGKDSESIPSGDTDPNDLHWLVNDSDDMSSCIQLNASCEETSNMSIYNDKNVLICQRRFSCPAEVEPDKTPFIIGTSHSCSVSRIYSSQPGSAIEECTTIPYLLGEQSLSNTGNEHVFHSVIDNCIKETNQCEKSLKNTQSSVDLHADAGSCGNTEFPANVHNLIDDRMLNCDAIADLSFESSSSRLMIDINSNDIVNLLRNKSLQAEAELGVSPEVQNYYSFKKDSGNVHWFSVETAFEAESTLIDLEESNTNERCNVLIDLLESDSNNDCFQVFSESGVKEEHHCLSPSVEELNRGYTTVFPGFENLIT